MKTTSYASVSVILEKRVTTKDNRHPIKLRITHNRKPKYYILKYPKLDEAGFKELYGKSICLSAEDFRIMNLNAVDSKKVKVRKQSNWYKTHRLIFAAFESRANDEIRKQKPFTFQTFEEKYFDKPEDDQDLFATMDAKAESLRNDGKFNTATIIEATLSSLKNFTKKEKYPFGNITVSFLKNYEEWMMNRMIGKKDNQHHMSKTTVSIYLRSLQAIFNTSAPVGITCPFGKGKYMIPNWSHNKSALTQAEVAKIAGYSAKDDTMEQRSRDLWLFSYLCNGINFKDLANLKYSNIKGDTIVFERAKTSKMGQENPEITVIITRQIGRIIDVWGSKPVKQNQFLFPILNNKMSAEDKHRAIKQLIRNTNKYMKRICKILEIPNATTYVARHSFATVLKRSGASVEFISESLGHTNISTTQSYLADFEIEEKQKWANKLLPDTNL